MVGELAGQGGEKIIDAIAVSPGIAIGRVLPIHNQYLPSPALTQNAPAEIDPDKEIERFKHALDKTRDELHELQRNVQQQGGDAEAKIFDAHLLIADDHVLTSEVINLIRSQHRSADQAFFHVIDRYAAALAVMPDEYIRERASDIRDVAGRILSNLRDEKAAAVERIHEPRIVIAPDLTPSQTASLNHENVLGFAVESGSTTSHTAILARSMQLPALVGIPRELTETLGMEDRVILDGYSGKLIVNPESRTLEAYRLKAEAAGKVISDLQQESRLRPETRDGFMVQLAANIQEVPNIEELKKCGASGVGLFRTEFMFMNQAHSPTEEEQFNVYRELLLSLAGQPAIIRTLDIGGDKLDHSLYRFSEQNPFLGLRGIRLCLKERQDLFRTQLRALLRAGVYGELRVMVPMVSCVEEIEEVRRMIGELCAELTAQKIRHVPHLMLGAMIETPSAALSAEILAPLVDFFSIGTNDLVQYTMSIDRGNEKVAYLYQPTHPAILELIYRVVAAARRHNIWVSVCGQMAAEPVMTPLLIGLGVHELSMATPAIAAVRRTIRRLRMVDAEKLAEAALSARSGREALELSKKLLREQAPEIAQLISL